MRLRACLGLLLLGLGACAHVPQRIEIELDGVTIEIKPKPTVAPTVDAR